MLTAAIAGVDPAAAVGARESGVCGGAQAEAADFDVAMNPDVLCTRVDRRDGDAGRGVRLELVRLAFGSSKLQGAWYPGLLVGITEMEGCLADACVGRSVLHDPCVRHRLGF
jgi:hypothetical protein